MAKMNKPSQTFTPTSTSTNPFMPIQLPDPSIRGLSFDQLLQNRGIRFLHRRAVPCPNLRSLDDNTHAPQCSFCGNKGYIYYEEKEIVGVFTSNFLEKQYEQQGVWEIGTAVITFPVEYTDGTQAEFNAWDQLVVPDFEIRLWELREYNNEEYQQVRYPITGVDYLASVESGALVVYVEGTDFEVVTTPGSNYGKIRWIGTTPGYNTATDSGSVFCVSYFANPVFSVIQNLRELRVTQEMDVATGTKVAKRLPQEVLVRKDFLTKQQEQI